MCAGQIRSAFRNDARGRSGAGALHAFQELGQVPYLVVGRFFTFRQILCPVLEVQRAHEQLALPRRQSLDIVLQVLLVFVAESCTEAIAHR